MIRQHSILTALETTTERISLARHVLFFIPNTRNSIIFLKINTVMKLIFASICFALIASTNSYAATTQLVTSGNISAPTSLSSVKRVFILRIQLKGRNDITALPSVSNGLTVYNLATSGTGENEVYPGLYYYDGKIWQRVENQHDESSVEFTTANPNNSETQFTPMIPNNQRFLYVSKVDGSEWTWNGTAYVCHSRGASSKVVNYVPDYQVAPY